MMLPKEWCTVIVCPGVDCAKPGIYRWEIQGAGTESPGIYIGKYTRVSRPTQEYRRNVDRILKNKPSHHRNGLFRRIHHALADAVRDGSQITLTILANAEGADLNRVEREFIHSERANLNGPVIRLPAVVGEELTST
jgi:hypothetical protein